MLYALAALSQAAQNGASCALGPGHLEPVAQEVEAELRRGAVGDVAAVRLRAVLLAHLLLEDADRQAEAVVDRPHPLGVAAGEVVVDGGDVDALADEGVEEDRQRGDSVLPSPVASSASAAVVHDDAGGELHVEGPHVEEAVGRHADQAERLGQELVERLAAARPAAQLEAGAQSSSVRLS